MASVQHLGGNRYKITISAGNNLDGSRKRITKNIQAKSIKAAEKQANLLEAEVLKGLYREPTHLTLAEYVEEWKKDAARTLAPKSYHRYCELLTGRIIPHLGNTKLEKLTPRVLEDFYDELRKPQKQVYVRKDGSKHERTYTLSETTVRHYHRLIRAILQTAFRKGILRENPCNRVNAPRAVKKELKIFDEHQILALINALESVELKFKVCIHIALAGGLRLGELMGLEWQDVDFNSNTITVRRTSQYLPGRQLVIKDPKTESSKRTITLPTQVMNLIRQLEQSQKEQQLEYGDKWKGKDFTKEDSPDNHLQGKNPGRLFIKADGSPMHPHTPPKWFGDFLAQNNLPPLPFHGLRHTSASYLIAAGQDVVTVAKRLGHSNSNTTLAIYAHAFKKQDAEAAARMEKLFNTNKESIEPE